jgi:hypothetical protein
VRSSMKENFDRLITIDSWINPQSATSPKVFTIHRQKQLLEVLKKYDGISVPFSHFSDENINDPVKRNKLIFPVIFAYICGILKIKNNKLIKPENLKLGERSIDRNEPHWL